MPGPTLPDWFARALDGFTAGDMGRFLEAYSPEAVHEFPIGPEPAPERLEGKAAIADYLKTVPERARFDAIDVLSARDVDGELIVEAHGRGTFVHDGSPFEIRYVWFIRHQHQQVSRFREYAALVPGRPH
jgi:ketosteroid isomerase-like protein